MRVLLFAFVLFPLIANAQRVLTDEEVFGAPLKTKSQLLWDDVGRIADFIEQGKISRSEGMKQAANAARTYFPLDKEIASLFDQSADIAKRYESKKINKKEFDALMDLMHQRMQARIAVNEREIAEYNERESRRKEQIAQEARERAEELKMRREQIEAERAAIFAEQEAQANRAFLGNVFRSIGNSMNRTYQQPTYQPPVRCTSARDFSGVVSTTCY